MCLIRAGLFFAIIGDPIRDLEPSVSVLRTMDKVVFLPGDNSRDEPFLLLSAVQFTIDPLMTRPTSTSIDVTISKPLALI